MDDQLLEALATDPHDLAPWSVYGDLLQSRGDPRGELIMLMLERARRPTKRMLDAQQRVIAQHLGVLAPAGSANAGPLTWRRGFVAELRIDTPEQLVAAATDPMLRFVESATLVIDGEHWDAWCAALANHAWSWRWLRVELTNAETIELAPLVTAFPAVETLRITCGGTELSWDDVRAPKLGLLVLVDAGDVGSLDDAELPQLRELRLLGNSTATAALSGSLHWARLDRVVTQPIAELPDDGESNAFVVVGAPIELAFLQRLAARMSGITQLSVRLAHLRWLPRPFTVIQLFGVGDDLPYGLAIALETVLETPAIALVEVDERRGRSLVLGKTPVRTELDHPDDLVRRAIDLALGCDPGAAILEDVLDELAASSPQIVVGDDRAHPMLTVIDPSAAPFVEPEEEDDEYDDEDDYGDDDEFDGPWDDELETVYEEPVLLVEERAAEIETSVEPDAPPPDEDLEPLEPTEHDALDRPEAWFEFRDHWVDRAMDEGDEPGEVSWPDPEQVANEYPLDLERQTAAPACVTHGSVLDECRWCGAPLCLECRDDVEACAACVAELAKPPPPLPPERPRHERRTY